MASIQQSRAKLSADRAREAFEYNPDTGQLRWKIRTNQCVHIGDIAGTKTSNGYLRVRLDDVEYLSHRLIWLHFYGEHPAQLIDHIDGNKHNNAIANLRLVDARVNAQNQKRAMSHSATGLLGVTFEKQTCKYKAAININGKTSKTLGRFTTAEEAHQSYLSAKRMHHAGCTL